MSIKTTIIAAMSMAALLTATKNASAQKGSFRIANTFHIASSGGWDYIALNPVSNRLYVSHGTQVNILDKNTGDSVGVILNTTGVHGIAFAAEYKKGFTSNGRLNTVSVFDINTNAVTAEIKTGENPDAIMYDASAKKVIVCNGHSNNLTIIDPSNNTVTKTVALSGKPETAVSDGNGRLYVNIEDKSEIAVVNTKTWKVEEQWKTGKGKEPAGLAIDIKTRRLFAGCDKLLIVMSTEDGKVISELPIGDGCDGVGFDNNTKQIFCSNGEGTMTIVDEKSDNEYKVAANVPTKKGARTLVVDETAHVIYLPTADFGAADANAEHKRPAMKPGSFQVLVMRH